jgi:hypothetical protein
MSMWRRREFPALPPFGRQEAARHPAFKALTAVRGRIVSYWRGISLPFPEPGIRLIRQDDIAALNVQLTSLKAELVDQAQRVVNGVEPQALRNNTVLRQEVATHLAAVGATLDGLLVDRPRRNILRRSQ